jgi:DNA-binding MarR family transcriptional regulator
VAGKLQAEIKQTQPFAMPEEEAVLNIMRTAEVLQRVVTEFLKDYDLSPTQYNVLRILRGAGEGGATCSQIGERMLTHDPDITRLLDRMDARGLLERERSSEDRRVVITRITKAGLALAGSIDRPLRAMNKLKLGGFETAELAGLIASLERVRQAFEI